MTSPGARRRLAVVLFNLGGPDNLAAVQPFLFNLFNDRAIIDLPNPFRFALAKLISTARHKEATSNYAHMGGASPLLRETESQSSALAVRLAQQLPGYDTQIFIAMRYWRPLTEEAAEAVRAFAPDEVVLLPLYPHYSTTTTGSSFKAWKAAYTGPGRIHAVCCYFDAAGLVAAHARKIEETFEAAGRPANLRLLFSAHGLPEKVIKRGDPYQWQVEQTCAAVAAKLGHTWDWQVCYQSRVGPMAWIGPSTPEAVTQAGKEGRGVLVTPIAFVSEHVETLVELDRDYAELSKTAGCPIYLRAPAVGVDATFIESLASSVDVALSAGEVVPSGAACRHGLSQCPFQRRKEAAT